MLRSAFPSNRFIRHLRNYVGCSNESVKTKKNALSKRYTRVHPQDMNSNIPSEKMASERRPIASESPRFALSRDDWDRLVLTTADGAQHVGVQVVRAFPVSDPEHHISFLDSTGRELFCVASLSELPADCRTLVEEELARRQFLPIITRVLNDPPDSEPTEWVVETDRGRTSFILESEDDVHRDQFNQVTIVDANGIRYLIPDPRRLDRASRRVLDRFL